MIFENTRNTRAILPDSIRFIRSDVPTVVTDSDIEWMKANKVTTIIDLREEPERKRKPCPLYGMDGFDYKCMPVSGGDKVPPTVDDVSSSYFAMIDERMDDIIETIMNSDGNVLYFCNAGKDRTGAVSAIILNKLGYDDEYIIADYLKTADNLRDVLKKFAEDNPDINIDVITPQRRYMAEFLEMLKNKGCTV